MRCTSAVRVSSIAACDMPLAVRSQGGNPFRKAAGQRGLWSGAGSNRRPHDFQMDVSPFTAVHISVFPLFSGISVFTPVRPGPSQSVPVAATVAANRRRRPTPEGPSASRVADLRSEQVLAGNRALTAASRTPRALAQPPQDRPTGRRSRGSRRGRPTRVWPARSGLEGDRRGAGVPGVEGLARRKPGGLAALRSGGGVTAGGFLDEEHAQDLGGVPALRLGGRQDLGCVAAQVGQPQAAPDGVDVVGQWRWGRRRHRWSPAPGCPRRARRCRPSGGRGGGRPRSARRCRRPADRGRR